MDTDSNTRGGIDLNAEHKRLQQTQRRRADYRQWGPWLSERAWGSVREDRSIKAEPWHDFGHDEAIRRVYRWNEDGLGGWCDRDQKLCFALALWNGKDPFLKERLFGLSGPEGNHGEDVKELYWYLDNTPTHSFAEMQYRYPQRAFPYAELRAENASRNRQDREYEITDTGAFADNRFFDIRVCYAKVAPDDVLIEIHMHNRAETEAELHLLRKLWFRNRWHRDPEMAPGRIVRTDRRSLMAEADDFDSVYLHWQGNSRVWFTDNEDDSTARKDQPWRKDAFNRAMVHGERAALNPDETGSQAGLINRIVFKAGETQVARLRLCSTRRKQPFRGFETMMQRRRKEADAFYDSLINHDASAINPSTETRRLHRQALAGMLWTKQFYHYDVRRWLDESLNNGHPRWHERNRHWSHICNADVISMPDKWEYPWYAVWDSAFHTLPLALVDIDYAKDQLKLFTNDRYMHPNGQLPAYEWNFDDVNPPVHAWATMQVYRIEKRLNGKGDRDFLEQVFHKLMLNFTWWLNHKDSAGNFIFEGGFLGLDNISVFDRSAIEPDGSHLSQADATGWMAFFASRMMRIALELAEHNRNYEVLAARYFTHFLQIALAINGPLGESGLWDEEDGFFHDMKINADGSMSPVRVRSLVGLLPMIACSIIEDEVHQRHPEFSRRMHELLDRRPDLATAIADVEAHGKGHRHLLSLMNRERLARVLSAMLDEQEFLSPFGIRSLSRFHAEHPARFTSVHGHVSELRYEPGEGETNLFGGNSNWRGPVWFPVNYLIIESLRRYHRYYGDSFRIECPTGSGQCMNLNEVADEITRRLCALFERQDAPPAWCGEDAMLASTEAEGLTLFHEYFDGDTGRGLGACHQTGWTGLLALLLREPSLQRGWWSED